MPTIRDSDEGRQMEKAIHEISHRVSTALHAIRRFVNFWLTTLLTAFVTFAGAYAGPAQATTEISQIPLYVGTQVEPNIVYNIDESWSMAWRYMPDEVKENGVSIYGNPWATGSADSGDSNGKPLDARFSSP
ncbi:MAG: hypothetical protein MZV65_10365 [Chromatiales bacterium]|nr:hypothetical protein [Chromatiales bacterium]